MKIYRVFIALALCVGLAQAEKKAINCSFASSSYGNDEHRNLPDERLVVDTASGIVDYISDDLKYQDGCPRCYTDSSATGDCQRDDLESPL
jgi:hypothetical protein